MMARTRGTATAALMYAGALLLTAAAAATVSRSSVTYETPDVSLVRADGKRVSLPQELGDGRPVLLNFIFTTCSSICPLTSRTLEEFQRQLGAEAAKVHLMSISIDPERSEEHTSELQSPCNLVCRLLLEKKNSQEHH